MITITIDWKTYKQSEEWINLSSIEEVTAFYLEHGYLEEVKENKEPEEIIYEKPEWTVWVDQKDLERMLFRLSQQDHSTSILEKLREKIIGLKNSEAHKFYWCLEICTILLSEIDFLTSPETPQFTPWQEEKWKDYILLPRRLTAENGAKALFIGEYYEEIDVLQECDGEDWNEIITQKVPVKWDTIKDIYNKVVEVYGEKESIAIEDKIELPSVPDFNWDLVMNQLEQTRK